MGRTKGAKNRKPLALSDAERKRRSDRMKAMNAKNKGDATKKPPVDDKKKEEIPAERGFFDRLFGRE